MSTIKTIGPSGDFTTLQAWYNFYKGNITADPNAPYIAEIDATLNESVAMTGSITDATHYFHVRAKSGKEFKGDTAAANIAKINGQSSTIYALRVGDDYTRIEHIMVSKTNVGSTSSYGIEIVSGKTGIIIEKCALYDINYTAGDATCGSYGLYNTNSVAGKIFTIRNCVIGKIYAANASNTKPSVAVGIGLFGKGSMYAYNNSVYGVTAANTGSGGSQARGIQFPNTADATCKIYNNAVGGMTGVTKTCYYPIANATHDYNAADDSTITSEAHDQSNMTPSNEFEDITLATLDLHIKSSTSTALKNNGLDLSTSGFTNVPTDDVEDDARSGVWEIGCDGIVDPVADLSVNVVDNTTTTDFFILPDQNIGVYEVLPVGRGTLIDELLVVDSGTVDLLVNVDNFDEVTASEDETVRLDALNINTLEEIGLSENVQNVLNELYSENSDEIGIFESISVIDLVVEVGPATDDVLAEETSEMSLDSLNIESGSDVTAEESVELLDEIVEMAGIDDVAIEDVSEVSLDILNVEQIDDVTLEEAIEVLMPELLIDIYDEIISEEDIEVLDETIELGIVDDFVSIEESFENYLDVLNVDTNDSSSIEESVELLDIVIELETSDEIVSEEGIDAYLDQLNVETVDNVPTEETIEALLSELNIVVGDDSSIEESVEMWDIIIELFVEEEPILTEEYFETYLDELFITIDDSITIEEYAEVLDIIIELETSDESTVSDSIEVLLPELNSEVYEEISAVEYVQLLDIIIELEASEDAILIEESFENYIDELFISVGEDTLTEEYIELLDIIIELEAFDETLTAETIEILLPELNAEIYDPTAVDEYVEMLDIIVEIELLWEEILLTQEVNASLDELFISSDDNVLVEESIEPSITELNVSAEETIQAEDTKELFLDVLFVQVNDNGSIEEHVNMLDLVVEMDGADSITLSEEMTVYLDVLGIEIVDDIALEENIEMLDEVVELAAEDTINTNENIEPSLDVLNFSVVQPMMIVVNEHADILDIIIELGIVAEYNFVDEDFSIYLDILNIEVNENIGAEENYETYMPINFMAVEQYGGIQIVTVSGW